MKCPHCGHEKSRVTDTRPRPEADLRYRRCANCNKPFTTIESVCVYAGRQRGWVADQLDTYQDFGPPLQAVPDPEPAAPAAEPAAAKATPVRRFTASLNDSALAECHPDAQPLLVEWWNVARRSKHGAKATWTEAAWLASIGRVAALPPSQQIALAQAGVEHGWQALKAEYVSGSGPARVTPLPTATGRPMPRDAAMLAALEQWPA